MIEDKYIGLALAVSSSLAIGTSFIITKKVALNFSVSYKLVSNPLLCRALTMPLSETRMARKRRTTLHI